MNESDPKSTIARVSGIKSVINCRGPLNPSDVSLLLSLRKSLSLFAPPSVTLRRRRRKRFRDALPVQTA